MGILTDALPEWQMRECKAAKGRFHAGASEKRCKQVHNYKYMSPNLSLMEKLWLNEFWNQVAKLYPPWLAPNLVTFVGMVAQLSAMTLLFIYSPNLTGEAPRWVYLYSAGALFLYQTMDGTDGKQAKQTKSGSALGELFDHGCDALATGVYAQFITDLMGFGSGEVFWSTMSITASYASFMTSNIALVYTGVLPIQSLDCQELQLTIMVMCVLSGLFGRGWTQLIVPLPFKVIPLMSYLPTELALHKGIYAIGFAVSIKSQLQASIKALRANKDREFRCPPTVTLASMGTQLVLNALAWNFSVAPVTTFVMMMWAFGDLMLRTIYIRIGDPDALCYNPAAWGILCASVLNPSPQIELGLCLGMFGLYLYKVVLVITQLTGCLGIPANPFIIRPGPLAMPKS